MGKESNSGPAHELVEAVQNLIRSVADEDGRSYAKRGAIAVDCLTAENSWIRRATRDLAEHLGMEEA